MAKVTAAQKKAAAEKAAKKAALEAKRAAAAANAPTEIPKFVNTDGELVLTKLKTADFPRTKAGKMAYCDYQVAKWTAKKATIERRDDPLAKKKAKIQKLRDRLAMLESEVEEEAE